MSRAIQLSLDNVYSGQDGPFGAVVVSAGKIVGEGVNRVTSTNDPTAHAEILAIRAACAVLGVFLLKDCEIYASCEPCPMCLGAIYWARLRFFGNTAMDATKIGFDDSIIYQQFEKPVEERSIPIVQIMSAEAGVAFRAWQEKTNKVKY